MKDKVKKCTIKMTEQNNSVLSLSKKSEIIKIMKNSDHLPTLRLFKVCSLRFFPTSMLSFLR